MDYLEFAIRHFGSVAFDLASSGAPEVAATELGYEAPDDPEARQRFLWAIAGRYQVPVECIVPALGASGAIHVVCSGLLAAGETVAVESPGYEPLWRVPAALGGRVVRFERSANLGEMIQGIDQAAKLVLLTNPHNPSAAVWEDGELAELAAALGPERYLVVDEVYRELHAPSTTCFGLSPNLLVINSATKCLGVPWARAGWICAPKHLAEPLRRAELFSVGAAPPGCFAWGAAAVEQAAWLLERVTQMQRGKREIVDEWLSARRGSLELALGAPNSLFVWVRDLRGRELLPLIVAGVEAEAVIVSPGVFFGAPDCFRMSFTLPEEKLSEGLLRLGRVLDV